jgi:hypothetical protein
MLGGAGYRVPVALDPGDEVAVGLRLTDAATGE